jgi:crossover junction endodeoxyribonuclease RuvC
MMTEKLLVNAPICVLGVDPGLSGAVAKIGRGCFEVRRDFKSRRDIAFAIRDLSQGVTHAVIELVHALPGQGVCSMFSFGRSSGAADAALYLSLPEACPIEEVSPQKWQGAYRRLLALEKSEPFDSRSTASKILSNVAPPFLLRKKDHNSADSILMACWKIVTLANPM